MEDSKFHPIVDGCIKEERAMLTYVISLRLVDASTRDPSVPGRFTADLFVLEQAPSVISRFLLLS